MTVRNSVRIPTSRTRGEGEERPRAAKETETVLRFLDLTSLRLRAS